MRVRAVPYDQPASPREPWAGQRETSSPPVPISRSLPELPSVQAASVPTGQNEDYSRHLNGSVPRQCGGPKPATGWLFQATP